MSTTMEVRCKKSNPRIIGKGPPFNSLNSCLHVKSDSLTCNLTQFVTSQRVPSAKIQPTRNGSKTQGFITRRKYSATSVRIQENCAPVSKRDGMLPLFNFKTTHSVSSAGTATTLVKQPSSPHRDPTDYRGAARFPAA